MIGKESKLVSVAPVKRNMVEEKQTRPAGSLHKKQKVEAVPKSQNTDTQEATVASQGPSRCQTQRPSPSAPSSVFKAPDDTPLPKQSANHSDGRNAEKQDLHRPDYENDPPVVSSGPTPSVTGVRSPADLMKACGIGREVPISMIMLNLSSNMLLC